jgi:hypothetical protein
LLIDDWKTVGVHGTLKLENRNWKFGLHALERGRNNFLNYASQLQATFARSQTPKASK